VRQRANRHCIRPSVTYQFTSVHKFWHYFVFVYLTMPKKCEKRRFRLIPTIRLNISVVIERLPLRKVKQALAEYKGIPLDLCTFSVSGLTISILRTRFLAYECWLFLYGRYTWCLKRWVAETCPTMSPSIKLDIAACPAVWIMRYHVNILCKLNWGCYTAQRTFVYEVLRTGW